MSESRLFLDTLYARLPANESVSYHITLSAIHPDKNWRGKSGWQAKSRHFPPSDVRALDDALDALLKTNKMGWGAFASIATCRPGLTWQQRGARNDMIHVPAIWADIDGEVPSPAKIAEMESGPEPPSIVVASGGGIHLYYLLDPVLTDLDQADRLLAAFAARTGGDLFICTQPMRVPGSINTKAERNGASCHLIDIHPERRYAPADLLARLPPPPRPTPPVAPSKAPRLRDPNDRHGKIDPFNPALLRDVLARLIEDYKGRFKTNGWLESICPCGHRRDGPGHHFNYHPEMGLGYCFGRHKRLWLRELCSLIGVNLEHYNNSIYDKS